MGRKSKHIEKLTDEQKSLLQKGYTRGKSHLFRRKCQCILLSNEGKTTAELSTLYGISKHSILIWFKRWENGGIEGLQLKPGRGRKPKLNLSKASHTETVKVLVENEPKNLNRVTAQIKSELGIDLSKRTLKRFLKNLNTDGSDSEEG